MERLQEQVNFLSLIIYTVKIHGLVAYIFAIFRENLILAFTTSSDVRGLYLAMMP